MRIFYKICRWSIWLYCVPQSFAQVYPKLPSKLMIPKGQWDTANELKIYFSDSDGKKHETTIDSRLQNHLTQFLETQGSPIAGVVMVEVKSGKVLAMAQGRSPELWGSPVHTGLYSGFPAASIFKTVVSVAGLELGQLTPNEVVGLNDGCGNVHPRGTWMNENVMARNDTITLREAYGHSCNSFFAKMAVNRLGFGAIDFFAKELGWDQDLPFDFETQRSVIQPPDIFTSHTQTIGKFAAGFGAVGLSPAHGAYLALTIAQNGRSRPLILNGETLIPNDSELKSLFAEETAVNLRDIMKQTLMSGTATHAFSMGRYAHLRPYVGGKTGTLSSKNPPGLATLFIGLMPIDNPQVAVASVVILQGKWNLKAAHLGAEALAKYAELYVTDLSNTKRQILLPSEQQNFFKAPKRKKISWFHQKKVKRKRIAIKFKN